MDRVNSSITKANRNGLRADPWFNPTSTGKCPESPPTLLTRVLALIHVLYCPNVSHRWGCPPSKFPWTYSAKETCYLLKGKVKVYPDGSNQAVEIGAGDLVEFPKGMSCTWDVSEEVDKHYKFE
ncbi:hypothetical protein H5410_040863 [Solanum commersonii]|uniref:(S)-ureidoglycine aminohydrolase cupin domain-containing protein n=1 Tax=Solanum commersonii TaxID=4109 RepID=A0A9J5XRD1_SOLCO|nr:hypothetical protein H5410_040863 [Solanum commersonii]